MKNGSVGNRIIVLGSPGSGKSTFAMRLSRVTGLPLTHLDNVWWNTDRTHISREEFDAKLKELLNGDKWIIDGDYSRTYEMRFISCDTVVFLDFDLETCMSGIRERVGKKRPDIPWVEESLDPELVGLVLNYREKNLPQIYSLIEKHPDKQVLIFNSRDEADRWLAEF